MAYCAASHASSVGTSCRSIQSGLHAASHGRFSRPSLKCSCVLTRGETIKADCLDRRQLLSVAIAAATYAALPAFPALADGPELSTFYGTASPPTSYGGYGGNAKEDAKYKFEYPATWRNEVINKVQKGTQGVDGRVFNPRSKNQQAFVITFGRAGEDNKSFRLGDVEQTLMGFAGADYDMQDALTEATNKKQNTREVNGQIFYDYEIESPDITYLSTITVNKGKVYAFFVKSPSKLYKTDEAMLRNIVASFQNV